jgi:type IV fimbrial biogenesis protein FimT
MASMRHLGNERRRGPTPRGFTLIELMVAIMVLGILLGVAVPSFRDAALSSRLTAYANDLVASAQIARSEAIKRNAPVTLCASADGAVCEEDGGWEVGWIVLTADGAVLQREQPLSDEFRFTETSGGLTEITFPATVVGVTPASFTVCRGSPVGKQERVVTISVSGNASVTRTTEGDCPEAEGP